MAEIDKPESNENREIDEDINEMLNDNEENDTEIEAGDVSPRGDEFWKRRSKTPTSEGREPSTTEKEADAYLNQPTSQNVDENEGSSRNEAKIKPKGGGKPPHKHPRNAGSKICSEVF